MTLEKKPSRFIEGFLSPYAAMPFWIRNPRLWLYGIWPVVINIALVSMMGYGGYRWAFHPAVEKLGNQEGFWGNIWQIAAGIGIALVLLILGILLFVILATILGAPFYDLMGERIEKDSFRDRPELRAREMGIWKGAVHSIGEALRRLAIAVPLAAFGFLLGFLPLIGAPLAILVTGSATLMFLVLDAWSYPLDRRHISLRHKFFYIRERFPTALGLGVGLLVLYLIPCAWFFGPPLSAIAGTRLYCQRTLEEATHFDRTSPEEKSGESATP